MCSGAALLGSEGKKELAWRVERENDDCQYPRVGTCVGWRQSEPDVEVGRECCAVGWCVGQQGSSGDAGAYEEGAPDSGENKKSG